jgi:hypothetical protein
LLRAQFSTAVASAIVKVSSGPKSSMPGFSPDPAATLPS